MKRLLVVEDEDAIREIFEMVLRSEGYEVHGKRTAAAALECLRVRRYDLVLTDFKLGREGNGVAVADAAVASGSKAIIVTGFSSEIPNEDRARHQVLDKPVRLRKVVEVVERQIGPA